MDDAVAAADAARRAAKRAVAAAERALSACEVKAYRLSNAVSVDGGPRVTVAIRDGFGKDGAPPRVYAASPRDRLAHIFKAHAAACGLREDSVAFFGKAMRPALPHATPESFGGASSSSRLDLVCVRLGGGGPPGRRRSRRRDV